MKAQMERLGIQMHGVNLTLEADNPRLINYASEHLQGMVTDTVHTPELLVRCYWSQGDWNPQANPFPRDGTLNVIGNRMLGRRDELIWLDTLRMRGLQLRFRRDGARFLFEAAYRFDPSRASTNPATYEYKKLFSLMRYLVYHPLVWYLRKFRGWTALHASALESEIGGIIIAGLAGVGKSTTCVALMQKMGARIVSENLILTNGRFIYSCYEPIRLDEGSLALLGNNANGLKPMEFPVGVKEKTLFHLKWQELPQAVKPVALFLPEFRGSHYVRPLSPALAAEKIIAINGLVRELDDFEWYAAALDYLWPNVKLAPRPREVLQRLTQHVRCLELGIDPSAGIQVVVDDIVGALTNTVAILRE